jgi:hypothetical protein
MYNVYFSQQRFKHQIGCTYLIVNVDSQIFTYKSRVVIWSKLKVLVIWVLPFRQRSCIMVLPYYLQNIPYYFYGFCIVHINGHFFIAHVVGSTYCIHLLSKVFFSNTRGLMHTRVYHFSCPGALFMHNS